jgi:thiol-disulfide isomerase/thioredoxin
MPVTQLPSARPPEPEPEPQPEPETPAVGARRRRVGPFSLRQVTIAIVAIIGAAIIGTLATRPLGSVPVGLPVPDPSAFVIGSAEPGLQIGDLAPELTFTDSGGAAVQLTDLDGNPIRLADLRGKAVWINFWASWCPPCQYETPTLRAMDERYRDRGLAIIGINVQQTVDVGRDYADRYGLRYTIGADVTGGIFHAYRVFALPTQFFIDGDGRLRAIVNGPLDDTRAAAAIEALLPPAGSSAAPTGVPSGS